MSEQNEQIPKVFLKKETKSRRICLRISENNFLFLKKNKISPQRVFDYLVNRLKKLPKFLDEMGERKEK